MKLSARGLLFVSFAALGGCVAGGYYGGEGVDYGAGAPVGYGVDFYEPYGYGYYGGCCASYRVGPPGRGWDRDHADRRDAGSRPRPAYRPAGPSRAMPSIPTGPRGGGGHPGGHGH